MARPKPVRPYLPAKHPPKAAPKTGYEDFLGRPVTKRQWEALKKKGQEGKCPE